MDPQDIDDTATAKRKALDNLAAGYDVGAASASAPPPAAKRPKPTSDEEDTKRHARLNSNRRAARESRRRKKVLVEELQRSVVFFTRTNAQLRQNNEALEGMLFSARVKIEGGGVASAAAAAATLPQATTATESPKTTAPPPPPPSAAVAASSAPTPPALLAFPADVLLRRQQEQQQAAQAHAQQQNGQNALVANWLAMAQAAQQANAAAGIGGLVPNPMLAIPGLFGNVVGVGGANHPMLMAPGGVVNPAAAAANFAGMAASAGNPFALGQQLMMQQQRHQMGAGPSTAGN